MPESPRGPRLYVDITKTKVVPAGSTEAAFMMHERDVRALGIDPAKKLVEEAAKAAEEPPEEEKAAAEAASKERARYPNKAREKAEDK